MTGRPADTVFRHGVVGGTLDEALMPYMVPLEERISELRKHRAEEMADAAQIAEPLDRICRDYRSLLADYSAFYERMADLHAAGGIGYGRAALRASFAGALLWSIGWYPTGLLIDALTGSAPSSPLERFSMGALGATAALFLITYATKEARSLRRTGNHAATLSVLGFITVLASVLSVAGITPLITAAVAASGAPACGALALAHAERIQRLVSANALGELTRDLRKLAESSQQLDRLLAAQVERAAHHGENQRMLNQLEATRAELLLELRGAYHLGRLLRHRQTSMSAG